MPSRTKEKNAEIAARSAALPKIPKELIDLTCEAEYKHQRSNLDFNKKGDNSSAEYADSDGNTWGGRGPRCALGAGVADCSA